MKLNRVLRKYPIGAMVEIIELRVWEPPVKKQGVVCDYVVGEEDVYLKVLYKGRLQQWPASGNLKCLQRPYSKIKI